LSYIAKIFNVEMDQVVNILIILFIIVFDPLAICLTIAFNFLNDSKNEPLRQEVSSTNEISFTELHRIPTNGFIQTSDTQTNDSIVIEDDTLSKNESDHNASTKNKSTYSGAVSIN